MTLNGHEPEQPSLLDELGIFIVRILVKLRLWPSGGDMGDKRR